MSVTPEGEASNLDRAVYALELIGASGGLYKATVRAGFVAAEPPLLDERYYRPKDRQAISLEDVFESEVFCNTNSMRLAMPLLQEGIQAISVRGRVLSAQTGRTALKAEVDKFCSLPQSAGKRASTRHATLLGQETAECFVQALPDAFDPRPRALQRAFAAASQHVGGDISPFRFW